MSLSIDYRREVQELQAEAKYYCIEELSELCEKSLKTMKKESHPDVEPICRVPLITSLKEEQVCKKKRFTQKIFYPTMSSI